MTNGEQRDDAMSLNPEKGHILSGRPGGMTNVDEAAVPDVLPFTRGDIEQTVPARFEQAAAHFLDHVALTGSGRRWTYRDLNRHANRIAHAMRRQAPSGAGCVAYLLNHSPEMVVADLAVLKAG